jgi:hypothetical protein
MQINTVLASAIIDQDTLLLDATSPHSIPDRLPISVNTGWGLILTDDTYHWHWIQQDNSNFSLDISIKARISSEGELAGSLSGRASGYQAQWIYEQQSQGTPMKEALQTLLLDPYPSATLDSVAWSTGDFSKGELSFEVSFSIPQYGRSFRDGVEFRPLVTGVVMQNPFRESTREVPIVFDAPEQISVEYEIRVPTDLQMPKLPRSGRIQYPGVYLEEQYRQDDQILRYRFDIRLDQTQYPSDRYADLRTLYRRWVELSTTRWMLERK